MSDQTEIDTDRVGDVGKDLRTDADGGFADAATRGRNLHGHGVEFGARITPSPIITEAKQKYATALANTEANLRAYQVAAGVLADAATEIAQMFKSTDMNSQWALNKVNGLINDAINKANKALGVDPSAPVDRRAV